MNNLCCQNLMFQMLLIILYSSWNLNVIVIRAATPVVLSFKFQSWCNFLNNEYRIRFMPWVVEYSKFPFINDTNVDICDIFRLALDLKRQKCFIKFFISLFINIGIRIIFGISLRVKRLYITPLYYNSYNVNGLFVKGNPFLSFLLSV